MVMCPGPHSMFCLWHSCSSLTSQQHLQDFSWNWKTDIKFATICAKQLFLSITLDAWYNHLGKQSRATSQGHTVSVGPSVLWPKLVEAPSVQTTKNTIFVSLFTVWSPPVPSLMFSWPVTLQYDSGFATYVPHTKGNDVIFFQEFCVT